MVVLPFFTFGAASEVEMKEKKDRVVDELSATRAAVEEELFMVVALPTLGLLHHLKGSLVITSRTTGIEIVNRAIEEPLRQL
jgi:chaperonin GroEL